MCQTFTNNLIFLVTVCNYYISVVRLYLPLPEEIRRKKIPMLHLSNNRLLTPLTLQYMYSLYR